MDSSDKKAVKGFILPIISGTLCLEAVTILIFTLIGKFSMGVVYGALWGTASMTVYYYMMATAVTKAANGDPDEAKKRVQASYSLRILVLLVLMGLGLYLATSVGIMNWIPMLLAVIYPRISISIWQLISNTKNMLSDSKDDEREGDR